MSTTEPDRTAETVAAMRQTADELEGTERSLHEQADSHPDAAGRDRLHGIAADVSAEAARTGARARRLTHRPDPGS